MCAGALGSPNKALCGTSNTEWRFAGGWHCQRLRQPSWCCWAPVPKAQAAFGSMPGGSTTGAPDWRDAAKLRKFPLADDIPQWTPSEGAENTRAFLAALREKCSTEIGAMTGLLLALFEERVDASKAGYELAQKLKRGEGGATPREELPRATGWATWRFASWPRGPRWRPQRPPPRWRPPFLGESHSQICESHRYRYEKQPLKISQRPPGGSQGDPGPSQRAAGSPLPGPKPALN